MNKTNRIKSLTSFAALAMLPGMCFAEGETAEAGGAAPETPAAAAERKRAPAANFLPIVRGRFPMLLVHAVRFDEVLLKLNTKEVAAKMATSVGKIFDIRKGRNFAYINAGWKPSAADVQEAKNWAAQIGNENAKGQKAIGDAALIDQIVGQYEARGLATAEEMAAFNATKPKTNFEKKSGEAAAPTGALPGSAAATAGATTAAGNADDLLG